MADIDKTIVIDGTNATPEFGNCPVCGVAMQPDNSLPGALRCPVCNFMQKPKTVIAPGHIVLNKYRILSSLSSGGFGDIFICHPLDDVTVRYVLKVLKAATTNNSKRFRREAAILASIKDEDRIARVMDFWEDDGEMFIVMEYINGMNLKQVMEKYDVDEKTALQVARETAVALQHIWEQHSIIHRDIKPENIMLNEEFSLKLLDFGLSKQCVEDGGSDITMANSSLGTPGYMSPEQFTDSRNVDFRTDIFSLGATMFYLLTGKSPSAGDSLDQIYNDTLVNAPPPAEKLEGKCSPGCIRLIQWMMQKDPDDRIGSYMELLDEIDQLLYQLPD